MIKAIHEAEGEVTARAIENAQGMMVLPAGITLTPALINALSQQGITDVEVKSAEVNAEIEQKIQYINDCFQPFNGPKMKELNECLVNYLTQM